MTQITIHCRLLAPECTRRHLWNLMVERNTPLINELLRQIGEHPDFETWQQQAKLSNGLVKTLCEPLRTDPRFSNQPGRFYSSAIALIEYIYKSWLTLQKRLRRKIEGNQSWLTILKSDAELIQECHCSLDALKNRAREIVESLERESDRNLFKLHDRLQDPLSRAAICHLLKNGKRVRQKPEDPEKLAKRRRKTEIKIQRLQEQIEGSIPKGRDLNGQR